MAATLPCSKKFVKRLSLEMLAICLVQALTRAEAPGMNI